MATPAARRDCRCPLARHQHGTPSGYWADGCRCFPCRVAYDHHIYLQRHGQPTTSSATAVDATGTRRRLEALHRLGWSGAELGAKLGVGYSAISQLRKQKLTFPRTADRVRDLYDELWAVPSTGRQSTRIARWAARSGFAPPLAWDDAAIDDPAATSATDLDLIAAGEIVDEVAVERAMHGDTGCATRAEVSQAVVMLTAQGMSVTQIADRIGVTSRTIQRKRAAA